MDRRPGLAGLHEPEAQHSSQSEQACAKHAQRAGLGNDWRAFGVAVVNSDGGVIEVRNGDNCVVPPPLTEYPLREVSAKSTLPFPSN